MPSRLRAAGVGALVLLLSLGLGRPAAQAESGDVNLHIDTALGLPIAGPTRPGGPGDERAFGGAFWVSADWQRWAPWALEAIVGGGGFAKRLPGNTSTATTFASFGVGARWRPLDDLSGYADEEGGNLLGNLWVSAHVGYLGYDGAQLGFDAGAGYELSVLRPLQLGGFVRMMIAPGGDNRNADGIFVIGINGSIGLRPRTDPSFVDSDGDGLSDDREAELETDPLEPDTDRDGLPDGLEVETDTNPLERDTDGDGLNDGREDDDRNGRLDSGETDPRRADTDGGGISDPDEVYAAGQDPRDASDDDYDGDGVPNPVDRCPGTPAETKVDEGGCGELAERMELTGIRFPSGSARILPESEPVLEQALELLRQHPDARIEIAGHTDNVGSERTNRRLSLQRARAVRNWLVRQGLPRSRFEIEGYGSAEPVAPNDTTEGRARNRRIEFRRID